MYEFNPYCGFPVINPSRDCFDLWSWSFASANQVFFHDFFFIQLLQKFAVIYRVDCFVGLMKINQEYPIIISKRPIPQPPSLIFWHKRILELLVLIQDYNRPSTDPLKRFCFIAKIVHTAFWNPSLKTWLTLPSRISKASTKSLSVNRWSSKLYHVFLLFFRCWCTCWTFLMWMIFKASTTKF